MKAELAQEELQPEEWGGSTQFAEVSAKAQQNLDDLLDRILLVADAGLDLRANPAVEASGPIVESRLDVGAARWRRCSSSAARSRSATQSSPATRTAA